jgi:hypothetical protein
LITSPEEVTLLLSTAKHVVELGQLTLDIRFVVPDDCCVQPVPPLLVTMMVW